MLNSMQKKMSKQSLLA